MEKNEKRFGIITIIVLALGVIFKFQHWPGASILFIVSVFFINLVYLPVNLVLGIRKATNFFGKAYVLIVLKISQLIYSSNSANIKHVL